MERCDSEGVEDGVDSEEIRMGSVFTEDDNPKVTRCQGVFTLQEIRMIGLTESYLEFWSQSRQA